MRMEGKEKKAGSPWRDMTTSTRHPLLEVRRRGFGPRSRSRIVRLGRCSLLARSCRILGRYLHKYMFAIWTLLVSDIGGSR